MSVHTTSAEAEGTPVASASIAAAKSSPFSIADLGRAERLVKQGEEVLARQKELVEHCRARGQGEESAARLLDDLEATLDDMIGYRDLVRGHLLQGPAACNGVPTAKDASETSGP